MMKHFVKEFVPVMKAYALRDRAIEVTKDMRIKPAIYCIDKKKAWDEGKHKYEVTEAHVSVIGYFYEDEMEIAKKLEEFLDLVSSL